MANQISKQQLVDYLKQQVEQYRSSMESYTTKGKYYQATEATYSTYFSLLTLVEAGMFDEKEYNVAPNGAMFDKSIPYYGITKNKQ